MTLARLRLHTFIHEAILWLLAYPVSVSVASLVLLLPFMISEPVVFFHSHVGRADDVVGDPLMLGAMKIIGIFCLAPAITVRFRERHCRGRVWPYVSGGAWTGFSGGAFLMSMPLVIGTAVLPELVRQACAGGFAAELVLPIIELALFSLSALSLTFLAGACGGLVLGLVARKLDTPS